MRRPAALVVLLGAVAGLAAALRRQRATRAESALWTEAAAAPDLR